MRAIKIHTELINCKLHTKSGKILNILMARTKNKVALLSKIFKMINQ